jgi:hypothetical protein
MKARDHARPAAASEALLDCAAPPCRTGKRLRSAKGQVMEGRVLRSRPAEK